MFFSSCCYFERPIQTAGEIVKVTIQSAVKCKQIENVYIFSSSLLVILTLGVPHNSNRYNIFTHRLIFKLIMFLEFKFWKSV